LAAAEGSACRLAAPAGLAEGEPAGRPFGGGEFSGRFCSAIFDLCPYRICGHVFCIGFNGCQDLFKMLDSTELM
jgi:hypothetical protein